MAIGLGYTTATDNGGSTSSVTTASGTTNASGSTFYVLVVTRITATTPTVRDSKSNTYGAALVSYSGFNTVYEFACVNGTGGASHTFTVDFGASSGSIVLATAEFTGVGAGTIDATPAGASSGFVTTFTAPSITTTVANELVINGLSLFSGGSSGFASTGSGFTLAVGYGSLLGACISYAVPAASSTAAADTYTWTGSNFSDAVAISIKPSGGGSPVLDEDAEWIMHQQAA